MLSKEEIEKDIKRCKELIKVEHANWIGISNQLAIAHILEHIEQLETDKQKLIEILDKYEHVEANEDNAVSMYAEFKEILKGEKE